MLSYPALQRRAKFNLPLRGGEEEGKIIFSKTITGLGRR
jgi:hypothetical protein